jgi:hypothetical protein
MDGSCDGQDVAGGPVAVLRGGQGRVLRAAHREGRRLGRHGEAPRASGEAASAAGDLAVHVVVAVIEERLCITCDGGDVLLTSVCVHEHMAKVSHTSQHADDLTAGQKVFCWECYMRVGDRRHTCQVRFIGMEVQT